MSPGQIAAIGIAAVLLFWALGAHNRLIALRNAIGSAWTQLDALLRRRHAAVEALLLALRRERPEPPHALDALLAATVQVSACAAAVRARPSAAPPVASLALAERVFGGAMSRLLEQIDDDPRLRTQPDTAPVMAELVEVESRLGATRQVFNDAVLAFNGAVRQFPTRLLSKAFGLRAAGHL